MTDVRFCAIRKSGDHPSHFSLTASAGYATWGSVADATGIWLVSTTLAGMRLMFCHFRLLQTVVALFLVCAPFAGTLRATEPSVLQCQAEPGAVFADCDWPPQFPCSDLATRDHLAGDVFGLRPSLAESGVTVNVNSTQYYQGIASGGLRDGFDYGGRVDYLVNINGQKLGLWEGLFVDLHGETRYGESANGLSGALLPPNLMLALPLPNQTVTALTGVKFTQALSENLLVFGGKINTLDGFLQPITHAGGTDGFMNTALMFNPTLLRLVPYSTLGAGFAYVENMEPIFSFLLIDTNNTPTVSGFDTLFNNGVSMLWQLNLPTKFMDLPGHQGMIAGYTNATRSSLDANAYFDPDDGLVVQTTDQTGAYAFVYNFDQALYVSPDDPRRMWGLFGSLGLADSDPSPIHWNATVGFAGSSPLRCRPFDTFGLAYSYSEVSSSLKSAAPLLLPLRNEQVVEFYYNIGVTKWCHITPDLQVIEPARVAANTALMLGVRAKINF